MLLKNLAKRQNARLVIIFLNWPNPCASIPPKLSGRYENPHDSKLKRGTLVFGFGGWELLLILIIVLIVFGAGKLPQLGEGLGKAVKVLKDVTEDVKKSVEPELNLMQAEMKSVEQDLESSMKEAEEAIKKQADDTQEGVKKA